MVQRPNTGVRFRNDGGTRLHTLGNEFLSYLGEFFKHNPPSTIWPMCSSCFHMTKMGTPMCKKFNAIPPVQVIVGDIKCEAYQDENEIPF